MTDTAIVEGFTSPPLTEVERVTDTFTAPSKTFTDILRKATFWGPLLIMILVGVLFAFGVQEKVGWDKVFENNMHQSPKQEESYSKMPEAGKEVAAKITAGVTYGYTLLILFFTAISALLVWVTVNFGFGGTSKYSQIYAVSMYSNLVLNVKFLLATIALFAGVAPDSFLLQNPVGTNIGYYLSTDAPKWLSALAMHIDLFEIWSLVLATIGVSIVAKVSRGKAAAAVVGWWLVLVLIGVGFAAGNS
jgi:Yip1 domain